MTPDEPARLRIKHWTRFQHYQQRKPPWIKLYRELLDDKEWHSLSGESAKGLIMLWLIASEAEGYLPDSSTLAFRLRISENRVTALLSDCSHWIEGRASNMLASRYQDATLEKETEKETEKEKEKEKTSRSRENHSTVGQLFFSGERLRITVQEHSIFSRDFEGIDLEAEYRAMDRWLVTNKRNYRAFGRFANTWLNRQRVPATPRNGSKPDLLTQLRELEAKNGITRPAKPH